MTATIIRLKEWVVVEHAGSDDPRDIRFFDSMLKAYAFCKKQYDEDEFNDLDVMVFRVLPDGSYTTEF
jgi:hypothetical protein